MKMHAYHCSAFIFLILLTNWRVCLASDSLKNNFKEMWRNQVARFNRGAAQLNFNPIRRLQAAKQSLFGSVNRTNKINHIKHVTAPDENSHFLSKFLSWTIARMVAAKTIDTNGLKVRVEGTSNNNLIRGRINKVTIKFNKFQHSQFSISGGGKLTVHQLEVDFRRMFFRNLPFVERPYTIHCDFNLTQEDIMRSLLIRKSLQNCVNAVMTQMLGRRNIASVLVTEVYVNSDRLYTLGTIAAWSDSSLSLYFGSKSNKPSSSGLVNMGFEVSTRLGVRENNPHVIYFEDLVMVLNPASTALRTVLPITMDTAVNVDLGELCTVDALQVAHGRVHFAGSAVISPQLALSSVEASSTDPPPFLPQSSLSTWLCSSLCLAAHTCAMYMNYAAALCGLSSTGGSSDSSSSWVALLPSSWLDWLAGSATNTSGAVAASSYSRNAFVRFNISSALSSMLNVQGGAERGCGRRSVLAWWSSSKEVRGEVVGAAVY